MIKLRLLKHVHSTRWSKNQLFIIHTHSITVQQIKCAISKLKLGKSDSIEQLSSENFKNGTHMLNIYISLLFTCMFTHGMPPSGFLLSTIVPISKNKRDTLSGLLEL